MGGATAAQEGDQAAHDRHRAEHPRRQVRVAALDEHAVLGTRRPEADLDETGRRRHQGDDQRCAQPGPVDGRGCGRGQGRRPRRRGGRGVRREVGGAVGRHAASVLRRGRRRIGVFPPYGGAERGRRGRAERAARADRAWRQEPVTDATTARLRGDTAPYFYGHSMETAWCHRRCPWPRPSSPGRRTPATCCRPRPTSAPTGTSASSASCSAAPGTSSPTSPTCRTPVTTCPCRRGPTPCWSCGDTTATLRAFVNMCRHRGMALACEAGHTDDERPLPVPRLGVHDRGHARAHPAAGGPVRRRRHRAVGPRAGRARHLVGPGVRQPRSRGRPVRRVAGRPARPHGPVRHRPAHRGATDPGAGGEQLEALHREPRRRAAPLVPARRDAGHVRPHRLPPPPGRAPLGQRGASAARHRAAPRPAADRTTCPRTSATSCGRT